MILYKFEIKYHSNTFDIIMILCEYMHLDTTRISLIPYWCISYIVSHRIVLIKYLVVSHLIPICVSLLIVKNRKISLIISHCSTWMEKTKNKSIIISRHIVSKISKKKTLTILRLDHNFKKNFCSSQHLCYRSIYFVYY